MSTHMYEDNPFTHYIANALYQGQYPSSHEGILTAVGSIRDALASEHNGALLEISDPSDPIRLSAALGIIHTYVYKLELLAEAKETWLSVYPQS